MNQNLRSVDSTGRILLLLILLFSGHQISAQDSFEFVVLPDTQTYVEEYPEIYLDQMQWMAENEDRFSFVVHVGDITQNNSTEEWRIAKQGFELIEDRVPYTFSLGNHDMGSEPGKFADLRDTSLANKFFSPEEIPNVIASFPEGTVDNLCSTFTIAGREWMVISLEFGPRNRSIEWAGDLIEKHPEHNVILVTHAYLFEDNTFHDGDDWWQPQGYGVGKDVGSEQVNNGKELWEKLVQNHKNIKMVFSGHILKSGVGTLVSTGKNGNKVYQMLANYQKGVEGSENGGNGFLRIVKVGNNSITVKTYSPWLDQFMEEEEHDFSFEEVQFN